MKYLIIIFLFFSLQLPAQNVSWDVGDLRLLAESQRYREWLPTGVWTQWDTTKCYVLVDFSAKLKILQAHNVQDMVFKIERSDNGRFFVSQDYEDTPLSIVLYRCPQGVYNVLFHYDYLGVSYEYQYLHARIINK